VLPLCTLPLDTGEVWFKFRFNFFCELLFSRCCLAAYDIIDGPDVFSTEGNGPKEKVGASTISIAKHSCFCCIYRVAQNKIPHQKICNISATSGLISKILEAA